MIRKKFQNRILKVNNFTELFLMSISWFLKSIYLSRDYPVEINRLKKWFKSRNYRGVMMMINRIISTKTDFISAN